MLRIVHIVPSISVEASGPSYSVVHLSSALEAIGVDSEVWAIGSNSHIAPGIRLFKSSLGRFGGKITLKMLFVLFRERNNIDILHNNGLWLFSCIFPNMLARFIGITVVHAPRGTLAEEALSISARKKRLVWLLLQRSALSNVKLFHATSHKEVVEILKFFPAKRIVNIPIGIDVERNLKYKERLNEIIFIGRIHPIKNLEMVIDSWLSLGSVTSRFTLRIIGPGEEDYRQELMSRAVSATNISIEEALYGPDKFEALAKAKWSILFSKSENFGVSIVESLCVATPVITSYGTPWEVIEENQAGFWIPLNTCKLASIFETVIDMDQGCYREYAKNAKDLAVSSFSWENIALEMERQYRLVK